MNGKQITKLGFEKKAIALALTAATARERAGLGRDDILSELYAVKDNPEAYLSGGVYADLARELAAQNAKNRARQGEALRPTPCPTASGERT